MSKIGFLARQSILKFLRFSTESENKDEETSLIFAIFQNFHYKLKTTEFELTNNILHLLVNAKATPKTGILQFRRPKKNNRPKKGPKGGPLEMR